MRITKHPITILDEPCHLHLARYADGELAVLIHTEYEPMAKLSINLQGHTPARRDEFFLKSWSENAPIITILDRHGILERRNYGVGMPHGQFAYGCTIPETSYTHSITSLLDESTAES